MKSFHKTFKYLHLFNFKTALNTVKECTPNFVKNVPKGDHGKTFINARILTFSPRTIGVEIGETSNEPNIKQDPLTYIPIINPWSILPLVENGWKKDEIGLPSIRKEEIQAARLIVIRRKKMKKHKRRKLWKRMRHRWARIRQKRRQRKEKVFQAELFAMIKEAEEFSAEAYVADKISRVNHTPLPTTWRHKKLPEFIIRQLMGLDKKINYKHTDVYKA